MASGTHKDDEKRRGHGSQYFTLLFFDVWDAWRSLKSKTLRPPGCPDAHRKGEESSDTRNAIPCESLSYGIAFRGNTASVFTARLPGSLLPLCPLELPGNLSGETGKLRRALITASNGWLAWTILFTDSFGPVQASAAIG